VHEAVVHGGLGAEIAAQVQEAAFDSLDAPIERIGAPYCPPPASPALEKAFVPDKDRIVSTVERMLGAAN
jgi:pyruvate dehydrogenase E1 component beta subunit